jgi:hypothetical protein
MTRLWIFATNIFLSVTKNSFLKTLRMSTWHMNALTAHSSDPTVATMITSYTLIHTAYVNAYNVWTTSIGTHEGGTHTVEDLLTQLSSTKIRSWDVAIQGVYAQGSTNYIALLPNRRVPFQKGTDAQRITAVRNLDTALTSIVPLAATKTDVHAFLGSLDTAVTTQQGQLSNTGTLSNNVDTARVNVCVGQYSNLGGLMSHFATDPDSIVPFFDLEDIRNHQQMEWTNDVPANSTFMVAKRKLVAGTHIHVINNGAAPLTVCYAANKNVPCSGGTVFNPGADQVVDISTLGDVTTGDYIMITNNSGTDGHFVLGIE